MLIYLRGHLLSYIIYEKCVHDASAILSLRSSIVCPNCLGLQPSNIQQQLEWKNMQHKEQILSAVEFRQLTAVPVPKQNGFPDKKGVVSSQHTLDNLQPGLVGKTRLETPRETGMHVSGKNSVAGGESQYFKLQKLSSQQAVGPVRTTTETKLTRFPFAMLFPFILPQLDEGRATQLRTLYEKLKVSLSHVHSCLLFCSYKRII